MIRFESQYYYYIIFLIIILFSFKFYQIKWCHSDWYCYYYNVIFVSCLYHYVMSVSLYKMALTLVWWVSLNTYQEREKKRQNIPYGTGSLTFKIFRYISCIKITKKIYSNKKKKHTSESTNIKKNWAYTQSTHNDNIIYNRNIIFI